MRRVPTKTETLMPECDPENGLPRIVVETDGSRTHEIFVDGQWAAVPVITRAEADGVDQQRQQTRAVRG